MGKYLRTAGTALLAIFSFACVFSRLPKFSAQQAAVAAADTALPLGFYHEVANPHEPESLHSLPQSVYIPPVSSNSGVSSAKPSSATTESSEAVSDSGSLPSDSISDALLDGNILETDLSQGGKEQDGIFIKNSTAGNTVDAADVLSQKTTLNIHKDGSPMVLIYHTHTCEAYAGVTSSDDPSLSVVAVGDAIAQELQAAGIGVIHDTTIHDSPNYNGCYDRSCATVQKNLAQYPSIQVTLDIHRDSMTTKDGIRYKPTAIINGKRAAQIMIISGCDDGTLNFPNWAENLKLAVRLQSGGAQFSKLMRPLDFTNRRYNEELTNGSLLCEFGTEVNTLDEAVYSGHLFGQVLSQELSKIAQDAG
ncbi:MAG: stage II sporulation protein P [Clostridiales bacterium]|nr:stage II sporulation protein P [Clostridiales bacterium]MCI2160465.1 stage II sporulation protein P [Oscillospiraceae bacterium]CAB1243044.1 Stage II sporulation protein P [Ruminococcaceae bacterium BL-4]MCI1961502.1 stage II sporulation protein P [Clostridiales bacterium]MCI2022089.1 stage II sporulation protein P [Clostridiales bacterium]